MALVLDFIPHVGGPAAHLPILQAHGCPPSVRPKNERLEHEGNLGQALQTGQRHVSREGRGKRQQSTRDPSRLQPFEGPLPRPLIFNQQAQHANQGQRIPRLNTLCLRRGSAARGGPFALMKVVKVKCTPRQQARDRGGALKLGGRQSKPGQLYTYRIFGKEFQRVHKPGNESVPGGHLPNDPLLPAVGHQEVEHPEPAAEPGIVVPVSRRFG